NGARMLAGFNTGIVLHSQTEIRHSGGGGSTAYYYSNHEINQLQHSNKFQVDVCFELDQPIGIKQNFMVGLIVSQNVNKILTANFKYLYFDSKGALHSLHVSDDLYPLTASVVLRYRIK
ncbi:MAG TPA: hypothetical protein VD905_16795, partial [Flavobacteriales bacterium]|nr:hypothetical protein [Flavobacteriales bacterium]